MIKLRSVILIILAAILSMGCGRSLPIKTQVPRRPAGQTDVLQLTAPALDTVHIGFIGIGGRGQAAVYRMSLVPGTDIVAFSDLRQRQIDLCQKHLENHGRHRAEEYTGSEDAWQEMCRRPDIDLVYIATDWEMHTPMALYAMEQGKHVAIEVPAALSLQDCWDLVNTSERTRRHCMMLENCCYDFFEINTLNMARQGVFGEVLHVEGSYLHYFGLPRKPWPEDPEQGRYHRQWRVEYNQTHRGDVYPTHGLGPICQVLNIHRGDRMKVLVSADTKAVNGKLYWEKSKGTPTEEFLNADQTSTLITTELGKTILVEHNIRNPQPYNRMYKVVGTAGSAAKYPVEWYCFDPAIADSSKVDLSGMYAHSAISEEQKAALTERYKDPIIKEIEETAREVGGHGGMDYIMDYRLIYCLRKGLPLDMDVYDLAEWCCIQELSRISLENGCAPVEVPDFTRGAWNKVEGYSHAF